jgi:antibiotic biosynthesis monooxygenase (ABM) superfamily enzyme
MLAFQAMAFNFDVKNMFFIPIALYFFFCLIAAFLGRKTELGFFKSFTLSLVITPLVSVLIIFFFFPAKISVIPKKYRERFEK